jgi:hypothetical protein
MEKQLLPPALNGRLTSLRTVNSDDAPAYRHCTTEIPEVSGMAHSMFLEHKKGVYGLVVMNIP